MQVKPSGPLNLAKEGLYKHADILGQWRWLVQVKTQDFLVMRKKFTLRKNEIGPRQYWLH
jgi:hypothetical protein